MKKETLKCLQCGGTNIEIISESLGKCKHCGSLINIEVKKEINSTVVIKSIDSGSSEKTPKIGFAKVKKKCTINDFTRQAYVDLYTSKITENICDSTFEPAITETRNYVMIMGNYEINYSANLGYDRKEKYLGTEKKKREDGTYYEKLVEKERIVTDWRPTTGKFTGACNAVGVEGGLTSKLQYETQKRFDKYLIPNIEENIEAIEKNDNIIPYAPDNTTLRKTYDWGAEMLAIKCKAGLGGDHCKDFSYTYVEKPDAILSIASEEFVLPYTIKNEKGEESKYEVVSFSNKIKPYVGTVPEDDFYDKRFNENVKTRKKSLFLPTIAAALLFAIILFCSSFATPPQNATFLETFFPALIVTIFISAIFWFFLQCIWGTIHAKAVRKLIKNETLILNHEKDKKKCNALEKKLKEFGYEPLSKEEKSRFIYLNTDTLSVDNKNLIQKFIIWLDNVKFFNKNK